MRTMSLEHLNNLSGSHRKHCENLLQVQNSNQGASGLWYVFCVTAGCSGEEVEGRELGNGYLGLGVCQCLS